MPYKSLLAILTGRDSDTPVLDAAHGIAHHFQSHVDALFVGELPRPLPYMNAGISPDFVRSIVADADAAVRVKRDRAYDAFRHWMQKRGICWREPERLGPTSDLLTACWLEWAGSFKKIGFQGRYADLIVMEHPGSEVEARRAVFLGGEAELAMFESGRPVFFVPRALDHVPKLEAQDTLVAWNGSAEAACALSHSLPLLVAARSVTVFCGLESQLSKERAESNALLLRRYLSLHSINAELRKKPVSAERAGECILEEAAEANAGLIVMGAFTHSRTRELLLGGATKYILSQSPVPVLMAH
jgi:nucleotide-binding universal stress UspA family protein